MKSKPNIVVVLTDDQGYGDAACYGATDIDTPNLDRLARDGIRFTDYDAPHASCSPSRAGLLTGCYPLRVSVPEVLGPASQDGLSPDEWTIATMLRREGYATACIGKWHLGHLPRYMPTNHGFDSFFGLPYSNDMWWLHPDGAYRSDQPPLMLMEGAEPVREIATMADQEQLTTLYTERAVDFIRSSKGGPFFLYLAHNMPHVPLAVSEKFKGKSKRGLYGDVIMEIDWSVGEVRRAIEECGIAENTVLAFTSDNGPWLSYGTHSGSAGPLREGKGTTFDGGQRDICIAWGAGRIPEGQVCREPVMGIDWLPTFAEIAGTDLPPRRIDGKSIWPIVAGVEGATTPHEALFFHYTMSGRLEAVRAGKWKLHFPHPYRTLAGRTGRSDGIPIPYEEAAVGLELFDIEMDVVESRDVAAEHPEVVERLVHLGLAHAEEINRNVRD
jgi:arylsulfatase A-like enzyme